jgi:hypothetical protein
LLTGYRASQHDTVATVEVLDSLMGCDLGNICGGAITDSVDYFKILMLANRRERDETNVTNDDIGRMAHEKIQNLYFLNFEKCRFEPENPFNLGVPVY